MVKETPVFLLRHVMARVTWNMRNRPFDNVYWDIVLESCSTAHQANCNNSPTTCYNLNASNFIKKIFPANLHYIYAILAFANNCMPPLFRWQTHCLLSCVAVVISLIESPVLGWLNWLHLYLIVGNSCRIYLSSANYKTFWICFNIQFC